MKKIAFSLISGIIATILSLTSWSEHGELSMAQVAVGILMYLVMLPAALYLFLNEIDKIMS